MLTMTSIIFNSFEVSEFSFALESSVAHPKPRHSPHIPIQAFVLTKGKIHYRTADRGRTWQSFEMSIPPSLVANPLSFHSDKTKYGYVLYQGTRCDREGWGAVCHDEVSATIAICDYERQLKLF